MAWGKDFWVGTGERVGATALGALVGTGVLSASDKLPEGHAVVSALILVASTALFTLAKCLLANLTNGGTGPGLGSAEVTPDTAGAAGYAGKHAADQVENVSQSGASGVTDSVDTVSPVSFVADDSAELARPSQLPDLYL